MMKLLTVVLSFAAVMADAAVRPLPDPTPFAAAGKPTRVEGEVDTGTFGWTEGGVTREIKYGALVFGNKEVAVRRHGRRLLGNDGGISVNVDGRRQMAINFAPAWGLKASEFPLEANAAKGTVTVAMPYVSDEGKSEKLVYRLEKAGPSRVKIAWRSTAPKGPLLYVSACEDQPLGEMRVESSVYRARRVTCDGVAWRHRTREEMLASQTQNGRYLNGELTRGNLEINPDDPTAAFSVDVGVLTNDWRTSEILEVLPDSGVDRWSFERLRGVPPSGEIVLDLHDVTARRSETVAVNGIDFEAQNNLHYELPPTKNLFRNPSFERGLLYWCYYGGGASFTLKEPNDRFVIEDGGLFGGKCLHMLPVNTGVQGLRSFPMPLKKGVPYTLSVWVKLLSGEKSTVKLAIANARRGGPIKTNGPWGDEAPESRHVVWRTNGWTRISRTFVGDNAGLMVYPGGYDCLFDGFQVEEGRAPTDFVAPPFEGKLVTADRDNQLAFGEKSAFVWQVTGDAKTRGDVTLTVTDIYGEKLGVQRYPNVTPGAYPLVKGEKAWPYKGVFLVRADYAVGGKKWFEYERFAVVDRLENRHPTRTVFGCFAPCDLLNRGDVLQRRLMEWGWGSTTWIRPTRAMDPNCPLRELFAKYRFQNLVSSELADYKKLFFPDIADSRARWDAYRALKDFTPEMEKTVEEAAYAALKDVPTEICPVVAYDNEEESAFFITQHPDGEVYGKLQRAFYKGAKRANPAFQVVPTHGTSGWNRLRGRKPMESYLIAAEANGFKYDAIAVHPYGNIDGGTLGREDADAEIAYLRRLLAKYGYDPVKTPLYMSECYNMPIDYVPQWGCDTNQDEYPHGKTGYDFGNREFQSACQLARMYLIYLKYWPQVKCVHCWQHPFIDMTYQPMPSSLAVNAIGHLLPDPTFVGEARPADGIRAYVWKSEGRAVAAVWAVDNSAELGLRKCPKLEVNFTQQVQFLDFMGNPRAAKGPSLQLTSAPLYVTAADAERLLADLKASRAPEVAARKKVVLKPTVVATRCGAKPDWTKVTSYPFESWHERQPADAADLSASYQVAWNEKALFVRVTVRDANLVTIPQNASNPDFPQQLWGADGALELYLDCGANGRANGQKRYDDDDYRYDFAPPLDNRDGRGFVWRFIEVDHQLADGVNMPTKEEAAKKVDCRFRRTADGYVYDLVLAQRYIEPLMLEKGFVAGFALYLHDFDDPSRKNGKALTTGTANGCHVQADPAIWPLMILK